MYGGVFCVVGSGVDDLSVGCGLLVAGVCVCWWVLFLGVTDV